MVFKWGTPMDRKIVVLVSKRWRDVGEDPSLWNWCRFEVKNRDDISKLSTRRLRYIQEICIENRTSDNWKDDDWEALFQKLNLGENNLSNVNPELFARALNRMEDLNLYATQIRTSDKWQASDWEALFQAVMNLSRLKKLDLGLNNLPNVNPELFARALTKLEDVNLFATHFSKQW